MSLSYCGETVRRHDPDRFLLSLFAAPQQREALWALYAFNHEIAKTREVVTETQLGLIRLQWWRDALAGVYEKGQVPEHQILQPLAQAIRQCDLPRELFDNLVYAREFDLEDRLPANMEGMVHYADFTSTPLLRLSLNVLDEAHEEKDIRSAGIFYALTGLLRAVPAHLVQRRCYLPEGLIHSAGATVHELYDGKKLSSLIPVVRAVAEEAEKHRIRLRRGYLKKHMALAGMYLAQLRGCGFDVFSTRLQAPPLLREARVFLS